VGLDNKTRKMEEKRKNCKAQGHIEIIFSFLIFIGFILFIFLFMNPFAKTESKEIINNIKQSIISEISGDVGKLSIITDTSADCYDFDLSTYGENFIEVPDAGGLRKYTIYYNDIFGVGVPLPCAGDVAYTLGTYSKENMIIYEKITELRTNYTENYEDLKTSLGIVDEFIFELKRIDGGVEIGVEKTVPFGVEVEAADIPIRVINSNGIISEFILNIRVW